MQAIEKPKVPPSPSAIIGVYMMDAAVWDILPTLQLSERNQYEITDVQNAYLARGRLQYDTLDCDWSDAGTLETLQRAAELVKKTDFLPVTR